MAFQGEARDRPISFHDDKNPRQFTIRICLKAKLLLLHILFYLFPCGHRVTKVVLNMLVACFPFLTSVFIVYDLSITFDINDHPLYL